jgi:CRISPR system Cascade subunit CasC
MDNGLNNAIIEFHILQSFPVTCLNRDDVNSPKTAMIGGTQRARVSSQSWKRAIRTEMMKIGGDFGFRTKYTGELIRESCLKLGANDEEAKFCKGFFEDILNKKDEQEKADTLIFIGSNEVTAIAEIFKEGKFKPYSIFPEYAENSDKSKAMKKLSRMITEKTKGFSSSTDIALFGRMVAQAGDLDVEAAASFSHAISTHKVSNEIDFFTALDDLSERFNENRGASHLGNVEFNSATYYRYICLDINTLKKNLHNKKVDEAIKNFILAIFLAVPVAHQKTLAGYCPWEYARIYTRSGQPLQVSFETAIKSSGDGYIAKSKEFLQEYLDKKESIYGSHFNTITKLDFGDDKDLSIDIVIDKIITSLKG